MGIIQEYFLLMDRFQKMISKLYENVIYVNISNNFCKKHDTSTRICFLSLDHIKKDGKSFIK